MRPKLLLAIFVLASAACAQPGLPSDKVYGTKTGKKYHRESCRSVKKSKIEMTLSEAKSKGLTPCKVCKPPTI